MRIGIDFDGVIADTARLKVRLAQERHGVTIPADRFKESLVVADGLLTRDEYRALMRDICGTREWGLQADEVPGAVVALNSLALSGNTLVVITSREGSELDVAKEWSVANGLPSMTFISTGYNGSKAAAARGLDVYIDDDAHKLEPLAGIAPYLFLFTQPYNVTIPDAPLFTRVKDWGALLEHLQEL